MTDQRNLILAIVLSVGIVLAFQYFYEMPRLREAQRLAELQQAQQQMQAETIRPAPAAGEGAAAPSAVAGIGATSTREQALAATPRATIDNGRVHGSVALTGGRLDDITLADYHVSIVPGSPEVVLLSPVGGPDPYFVEHGWWVDPAAGIDVPDRTTAWTVVEGSTLAPGQPLLLRFDNGQGLTFERRLEIDADFMLTVTQRVVNTGAAPVTLHPYGLVSRWGTPPTLGFYILHEGPIGVLNGTLKEPDYSDLQPGEPIAVDSTGGWLGITDKYWLVALIPDQETAIRGSFRGSVVDGQNRYQVDYLGPPQVATPGSSITSTTRVFAGAKELDLLIAYRDRYAIPLFDYAVDFGWFWFLTKPIFFALTNIYKFTGNYGVAILIFTFFVKLLFFPLANKSYRAMSQMKLLQPKMLEIREKYGDDRARMNQEMMALYKREKVNPMAGCLPIIVQIPVFFALYKVLFVSIEMRHAPFFGWIQDLSAPDPTSIFNLFGLLPFGVPAFLMIGVWPLLMGLTMYLQMKLNPQPADPIQARILTFLPLMFIFLFATFPAGLVIYWTWNNILSIAQQWIIMKRMGAPTT
jgi:YidC/Oxa1 family membrane protein insertase